VDPAAPSIPDEAATFRPLLASLLMAGAEVLLPAAQARQAGLAVDDDEPVTLTVQRVEVIWRLHVTDATGLPAQLDLPMGARPMARGARRGPGRPLRVEPPASPPGLADVQDLGYDRYDG
jgi:hypothetical protein